MWRTLSAFLLVLSSSTSVVPARAGLRVRTALDLPVQTVPVMDNQQQTVETLRADGRANVRDFGAAGDGIVDDTAAIQAAIDATKTVGGGLVHFPSGQYRLTAALVVDSNVACLGQGRAVLMADAAEINLIQGCGVGHITIDGLWFEGNGLATALTNGSGVFFKDANDVTIRNCRFNGFGCDAPGYGSAINCAKNCSRITIANNLITGGLGIYANDIVLYAGAGESLILGNRCYSGNSQGIYCDAATPAGRIIIADNLCANHCRHGILAMYGNRTYVDTIVANNICWDNLWTGVYVQGNNSYGGSVIVSGNIIRRCGGNSETLSGGIVCSGAKPTLIEGNYLYDTGGYPGVSYAVPGIRLNSGRAYTVNDNIIDTATGPGVHGYNRVAECLIQNNRIQNTSAGIYVNSAGGVTAMGIRGNYIWQPASDGHGIYLAALGSDDNNNSITITDNTIVGAKTGTNKYGIYLKWAFRGSIAHNICQNWDTGLISTRGTMSASFGSTVTLDRNQFTDCALGCSFTFTDRSQWAFGLNNVWTNCGTNVLTAGGNRYRNALATHPQKVYWDTSSPSSGFWNPGDTVYNSTPTSGSPSGWVCSEGGSPGTWLAYPNLQ